MSATDRAMVFGVLIGLAIPYAYRLGVRIADRIWPRRR